MNTPETTEQPTPAVASGVLLACPFCGHLPRLKSGKVKCVNNQCKVQPKTATWYAKGYEQNAVDDWNTRRPANAPGERPGETLDQWKARHGINPARDVNQDELLMAAEESQAKGKSWCFGCDKHMPIPEMKLITRSTDHYLQYDEGETDYIKKSCRVRMCPPCYKEHYESED